MTVSIPFSSGCALQSGTPQVERHRQPSFQFPFRRDVLCNGGRTDRRAGQLCQFQFPFRRDVLCNIWCHTNCPRFIIVSIPFSSGCALQYTVAAGQYDLIPIRFNSLFVGMCFAIAYRILQMTSRITFQFPFRRDVLCNHQQCDQGLHQAEVSIPFSSGCALQFLIIRASARFSWSFNSLFVGMCFAIEKNIERLVGAKISFNSLFVGMCFAISWKDGIVIIFNKFQFPFRRDVLCNIIPGSNPPATNLFQFPFRRDVLCNGSPAYRYSSGIAVSIPFSSGCALQSIKSRSMKQDISLVSIPFSSGCALQYGVRRNGTRGDCS